MNYAVIALTFPCCRAVPCISARVLERAVFERVCSGVPTRGCRIAASSTRVVDVIRSGGGSRLANSVTGRILEDTASRDSPCNGISRVTALSLVRERFE